MATAYIRTSPYYMPKLRAWRPVRIKVIIEGKTKPSEVVHVKIHMVKVHFHYPWGPQESTVVCTRAILPWLKDDTRCEGTVIIWPTEDGSSEFELNSKDSDVFGTLIGTREDHGPLGLQTMGNKGGLDGWDYRIRRTKVIAKKALGATIGGSIPYVLFWLAHGWIYSDTQKATSIGVTQAPVEIPAPQADPQPESVALIPPRMDCIFLDPNREEDANGQVHVKCGDDFYQATATYKGEGRFEFSVLNPLP